MLKKLLAIAGAIAALWLVFAVNSFTLPVVFLHYSAAATAPVTYFFNEDNDIVKDHLVPGESIEFRTARRLHTDYFIDVSLPFASRDGVEIRQPFSRVDIYIGPDTKIERTVVKTDFLARVASK
ncbi:hypothetical protein [Massilia rhizosphaerae]|uniref:hypothetical protein n=1 Tax=Massilia rhizosphaerae TaxID=2784389 RepID=UPI0018DE8F00|nr:hypothetical protein [Massilia rhizosphaerae]